MKETTDLLDKWATTVAEALANTAPEVWEAFVRGVVADDVLEGGIAVAAMTALVMVWRSLTKSSFWKDGLDPNDKFGVIVLGGLMSTFVCVLSVSAIQDAIVALYAPQYVAIKAMLDLAR